MSLRSFSRRIAKLEANRLEDLPVFVIILTSEDPSERRAEIIAMNCIPTATAIAERARLVAEGYQVKEGYGG